MPLVEQLLVAAFFAVLVLGVICLFSIAYSLGCLVALKERERETHPEEPR